MTRPLDLGIGLLLAVVLLPVLAVIAIAVRLDSTGPILHRSLRAGRGGETFAMVKFRTMRPNAERDGPAITGPRDPRMTRVGRFLRRHRLDELPQLWNVARGDMALVGPRPEDPRFVALYGDADRAVLAVRPGLCGAAQLAFKNEERLLPADDVEAAYVRDILPRKLAIDRAYVHDRSLGGDLAILGRSVLALFR